MLADELIRHLRAPDQRGMGRVVEAEYGAPNIDHLTALDVNAWIIRAFDHQVIPGLLQTPQYSAGVIWAADPKLTAGEVRRRMLLKSHRTQAFLARTMAASDLGGAFFVIGESAIIHSLADTEVHALQLRHLLTLSAHAKLSIQVLPGHKVTPALAEHFLLYTFPDDDDQPPARLGYLETIMGGWYSTRLDDMARMHNAFSEMMREAMSPEQSRRFIREVLAQWRAARGKSEDSDSESPPTPGTTASELQRWRREP